MGFFDKLKNITGGVFGGVTEVDDDFFDELEERLILADMGVEVASDAVQKLRDRIYAYRLRGEEQLKEALRDILALQMREDETAMDLSTKPSVILVVGVNGVGKTTSIGKIAHLLRQEGKSVLLCAADTFRAAAADQLEIWAERADCQIVRQYEGADPGAVLFDALQAAKARQVDVVICDGFVGNIVVKMSEGLAKAITHMIKGVFKSSVTGMLGGLLAKRSFAQFARTVDYAEYGGAPLLGLKGLAIVCHGRSSSKAMTSAIRMAGTFVRKKTLDRLAETIQENDELTRYSRAL